MPDRHHLVSTLLWLPLLLAPLAAVVAAPTRTPGSASAPSRPDGLHRSFAPAEGGPTACLDAATPADAAPEVDALPFEDEEQDRLDAPAGPRVGVLVPWSFRKVADYQSIAPRSLLSLYPLRC